MKATWTGIGVEDWGLYQDPAGLTYGTDAVLLASFCEGFKEGPLLDMGTGTGIIAFLLAHRYPDRIIVGADIQENLVHYAEAARKRNKISEDRLSFVQIDLRTPPKDFGNRFSAVLCNPPYFKARSGRLSQDPARATARHAGSFSTSEVMRSAAYCLRQGGRFFLIQHAGNLDEVLAEARKNKLKPARLQSIHPQPDKEAKLFLLECIYEGRQDLRILPPLALYLENGEASPKLIAAYEGVCDYVPIRR